MKVGESYKEKIKKIFFYQAMAVDDVVFGDLGRVPIPVHLSSDQVIPLPVGVLPSMISL